MDPSKLAKAYISPRSRAQKTFNLLFGDEAAGKLKAEGKMQLTENVAEWDYGYVYCPHLPKFKFMYREERRRRRRSR